MHIHLESTSCVLGGRWPVRLALNRHATKRLTTRAALADDGLDRLEWFFGAGDAGAPHWHQGQTIWSSQGPQLNNNRPAAAKEGGASIRAPGAAGVAGPLASQKQLSQLSVSQLGNLKAAADRATAMMEQLQRQAAAQMQSVAAGVRTAEGQLQERVQGKVAQLAQLTEAQLGNLREALLQVQTALRSQREHHGNVSQQPTAGRSGRDQRGAGPAAATPVAARLRQEVQQGLALLHEMSEAQLSNLQLASQAVQGALARQAQRVQTTLQRAAVRAPAQRTTSVTSPRSAQRVARATSAPAEAPAQQVGVAAGVSNLQQAAARMQRALSAAPGAVAELPSRLHLRAPSVALPTVAIPPIHLPTVSRAELSRGVAGWAWALAAGAALLVAAALRWLLRRGSRRQAGREQSVRAQARSRRALDRQKDRFRQALSAEGSTDTSVFSAVSRKGANSVRPAPEASSDEEDDDAEEGGGGLGGPDSWDDATRKRWEEFVRGSKLPGAAKMWDTGDVDEGLPKVYVDLDKE